MYVHAYQSYVWNAIVSERIRIHGSDKPIVGDLVFDTELDDKKVGAQDHDMAVDDMDEEEPEKVADVDEPGMFFMSLCVGRYLIASSRQSFWKIAEKQILATLPRQNADSRRLGKIFHLRRDNAITWHGCSISWRKTRRTLPEILGTRRVGSRLFRPETEVSL
jgi:tRNA(Glu) U13 pseudouridine synthase TruD